MSSVETFGQYETAWCPGCGNFSILKAVKQALAGLGLEPHQVLAVSGIGQAAKTPQYYNCNMFNGLHGRSLPPAIGAKLANPELTVLTHSGDGCNYGEGGNHFTSAIRRNIDLTLLVHDNQVYGLTKGQASPMSQQGFVTKAQPDGVFSRPFNPLAVAVALNAGFVARGFSGYIDDLVELIRQAIAHPGFSLVDILQPCPSFNKVNTFAWYKQRAKPLSSDHDPTDQDAALKIAMQWGDSIPIGVIYKNDAPTFESYFPTLKQGPIVGRSVDKGVVQDIMMGFA